MGLNRSQFNKIRNIIDQRKLRNQQNHYQRKETVYGLFPELKTMDQRIAALSSGATRKIIENPTDKDRIMSVLKSEIQEISAKKSALLEANGYPEDYLKPIYDCALCEDTGYVDGERCRCLINEILKFSYGQSNLAHIMQEENFDTFDLTYYSDQSPDSNQESPREIASLNYKTCYDFAVNFGKEYNNLILYGQAGLGKTFLCNSIAKEVLDRGFSVIYLTAFQLFRLIETYRFHNGDDQVSYEDIQALHDCDLLIIDDLGTEVNNAFTTSELFSIINNRLLTEKPIVISTNLDPKGWTQHYSDRIVSRIIGHYLSLGFVGSDIRVQKKFR